MPGFSSPSDLPAQPICYDEPGICYDEPCLCYNGIFDLVCLFGQLRSRVGGRGTSPTTAVSKSYPEPEMIDLLFRTSITSINKQSVETPVEEKKYAYSKESDVDVVTDDINVAVRAPLVSSQILTASTSDQKISSSGEATVTPKDTQVSSSITQLDTKVSSSINFLKPRKIILNTEIINNSPEGEEEK